MRRLTFILGILACGRSESAASAPAQQVAPVPNVSIEAGTPVGPTNLDVRMNAHLEALHAAGDAKRCDEQVANVRKALADDGSISTADLAAERRRRDTAGRGAMPYPSPGTACALFGIQKALDGALHDRGVAP